jgi:hypothetical protein
MRALLAIVMPAAALLVITEVAAPFGSFKANRDVWEEQYEQCHGQTCDGNHDQWLLPILDTSEGIFCYHAGDASYWPPGECMQCGQMLNAWLLNLFWDHTTPAGGWYHFFYWGNMAKVSDPIHGASQQWLVDYRPEACPGVHGAYVVGVDHQWRDYSPDVNFTVPRMSMDPVLPGVTMQAMVELGRQWDELGRWARRIIVFGQVYDTYAGVPPAAVHVMYATLPPGSTVLDYWDRAYSLAWQWWIYESGDDGENTLRRDRPAMAMAAPYESGIPLRTSRDADDMQDIINETYALFGENLTPVAPATWGRIKARFRGPAGGVGGDADR